MGRGVMNQSQLVLCFGPYRQPSLLYPKYTIRANIKATGEEEL